MSPASLPFSENNPPLITIVTVVRNDPEGLLRTIESVRAQTYSNIEYLVIDGKSTDGTIDVIRDNSDVITSFVSESDYGIYDAMNKGIALAKGDFICLLNAGDTYCPDQLTTLYKQVERSDMTVAYSHYAHGDRIPPFDIFGPGILLHYLGINHGTMLVPAAVYKEVGRYDPRLKICADQDWMRRAYLANIQFTPIPDIGLFFEPGGASTAQNEEARQKIIYEHASSIRRIFPFLPINTARSIYLYRFDEKYLDDILRYITSIPSSESLHPRMALLREALRQMLPFIWRLRKLDAAAQENASEKRLEAAALFSVPKGDANIHLDGRDIGALADQVESFTQISRADQLVLHYVEVFSRRSETFIHDLITRLRNTDGRRHITICDTRLLQDERKLDDVFCLDVSKLNSHWTYFFTQQLVRMLRPNGFVFHFAVNGWRFLSRLAGHHNDIPALFMTHGIDVFSLDHKQTEYATFIKDVASAVAHYRFTAPTGYLRDELARRGVPFHKIDVVNNTVSERFFTNRLAGKAKRAARLDSGYDVRICNIGRLVPWKNQSTIIEALKHLRDDFGYRAHLTIVYGDIDETLSELQRLVSSFGLDGNVSFRAKVNFDEEPRFFDEYDLFVSASTYKSGKGTQTESFGLSILEAILSGLPVVVTDVGGQPEVIGAENAFARLVENERPLKMAAAIAALISEGALDADNYAYANERRDNFHPDRQLRQLSDILDDLQSPSLKVALFTTSVAAGAGSAARRVHNSLLATGALSTIHVRDKPPARRQTTGASIHSTINSYSKDIIHPTGGFILPGNTIFSVNPEGFSNDELLSLVSEVDVVNLHWVARFLSVENIATLSNLSKPLVITVRDMHPLTGGCHFFHGCDNWQHGCYPCPQFIPQDTHLPAEIFLAKKSRFNFDNIGIVVLSEHTRQIIARSPLFRDCEVRRIPNPIDTMAFTPRDKAEARKKFGIDSGKRVIAYLPSFSSEVKGGAEALQMFNYLQRDLDPNEHIILLGGRHTETFDQLPFAKVHAGYIDDDELLSYFYSAADVTLVPSLEETFSNTAAESIACGTPVAGFATGAIPDLAQGRRGIAVPVGDTIALAGAVRDLLKRDQAVEACSSYIKLHCSEDIVGHAYQEFFRELVAKRRVQRKQPLAFHRSNREERKYLSARISNRGHEAFEKAPPKSSDVAKKQLSNGPSVASPSSATSPRPNEGIQPPNVSKISSNHIAHKRYRQTRLFAAAVRIRRFMFPGGLPYPIKRVKNLLGRTLDRLGVLK